MNLEKEFILLIPRRDFKTIKWEKKEQKTWEVVTTEDHK